MPVNPCLSCLFIGFNVFCVIAGRVIITVSFAELSPSLDNSLGGNDVKGKTIDHIVLYIVVSLFMVISILGVFGALQRSLLVLTVYLVIMWCGCLLMLRAGIPAALARPELEKLVEERWSRFLPLDLNSADIKSQIEALQTSLHCCGWFGHEDWGRNIPDSCLCSLEDQMEDKCVTDYSNFQMNIFWQKKSIFKQHCFPLMMDSVITNANVTLGVVFTLLVLALLGFVLSSLIMCQMSRTPQHVPVMIVDQPPAYQQLFNLPE